MIRNFVFARFSAGAAFVISALGWLMVELPAWAEDSPGSSGTHVVLVVGAAGQPEYGKMFANWAAQWEQAAQAAGASLTVVGQETQTGPAPRQQLFDLLQAAPKTGEDPLWIVLLGHGTFDGQTAKFNLTGPDFSAGELAEQVQPFRRPLAVVNCSSASAPFLNHLAGPNRVIVTATKSGFEHNFARFGEYFSAAIANRQVDLDKDGQTSLLEAFLAAAHDTAEFYRTSGRLATEHPLLDDNADGKGTPADWYRGLRVERQSSGQDSADGALARTFHLGLSAISASLSSEVRRRRDELESAIERLRSQKRDLSEDEYYQGLELLLVELARLYEDAQAPSP